MSCCKSAQPEGLLQLHTLKVLHKLEKPQGFLNLHPLLGQAEHHCSSVTPSSCCSGSREVVLRQQG